VTRGALGRWTVATAVFLGIVWISVRFGHSLALALLVLALLCVFYLDVRGRRAEGRSPRHHVTPGAEQRRAPEDGDGPRGPRP